MPNIGAMMKLPGMWKKFSENHPRFTAFLNTAPSFTGEGTVIDIAITDANGKKIETNLKLDAEDMKLFNELKEMQKK